MTADMRGKIEAALARACHTHTVEDVVAAVQDRRAFPWLHKDGLIVAELMQYPQHSELNCWIVAGKLSDCLELLPEVEAWGRQLGAKYITGIGRRGFKRVSERLGWNERGVVMCKELTDGQ